LFLDVSSLALWSGPAVGIARVEQALYAYARDRLPEVEFSFLDPKSGVFHALSPAWRKIVLGWDGQIDLSTRTPWRRAGLRRLLPSRYRIVMALERRRLTARSARVAAAMHAAQRAVLALRSHTFPFVNRAGERIAMVPFDLAVGPAIAPGPGDVILSPGADWAHKPASMVAGLKARLGFRYAVVCYDLIPILFPDCYSAKDVAAFTAHWRGMFALADLVICNSRRVAADVAAWCAGEGIVPAEIAVAPLGYDPAPPLAAAALPEGLEPGRYALFVSTIEPRKGHAMLLRAWRRLREAGVVECSGFKLVFVGRPGWMVDELLEQLQAETADGGVVHLRGISDAQLTGLYREAAFCVYPSRYEGFGLPLIEAFAHGTAVISSTGGSLPEVAAGRAPCLDPADEDAWVEILARWIEDPAARAPYEAAIRAAPPPESWERAAGRILSLAAALLESGKAEAGL